MTTIYNNIIEMLSRFNIIVTVDANDGIGKENYQGECIIPDAFGTAANMKFIREKTIGSGRNVCIMGRYTYELYGSTPLPDRTTCVISSVMKSETNNQILTFTSLVDALQGIAACHKYETVYIIGGEKLFNDVINRFLYLCDNIYVTKWKTNFECSKFFPFDKISQYPQNSDPIKTRDYTRYTFCPNIIHPEYGYLKLLQRIHESGDLSCDRTGTGTYSEFGVRLEFDISKHIPILTTKEVNYRHAIAELLWMLSGSTDSKLLEVQGINYWKSNTSKNFLESRGLNYREGDLGPAYGFQWRHSSAEYTGCESNYTDQGIDQIQRLIHDIKTTPSSRRLIVDSWNVKDIDKMALPCCHNMFQFHVSGDRQYLDIQVYQRSGDMFLGIPYNLIMYSVLCHIISHLTHLTPRKYVHIIGDAHIYKNHMDAVRKQLTRTPRPMPTIRILNPEQILELSDFNMDNIQIENYESCPKIPAPMSV